MSGTRAAPGAGRRSRVFAALALGLGSAAALVLVLRPGAPPVAPAPPAAEAPLRAQRVPVLPPPRPAAAQRVETHWVEQNELAVAALAAGELARALLLFEQCHAAEPAEPAFRANLAEALVRSARRDYEERGTRDLALARLTRAVALAPERAELAPLLARWRLESDVEAGFTSDESELFVLSYDGARTDLLHGYQDVLDVLTRAYGELWERFRRDPVREGRPRVRVTLYEGAGFDALTGLGHWAGGAFDGTVRVPVRDLAGERATLERVLRHELVHWFVSEVGGPDVPGWLNEGLAQWVASGGDVAAARRMLAGKEPFGLAELAGSLAAWPDPEAVRRAYAQSLALTEHVARSYGEELLFALVRGCLDGTPVAETFRSATGVELSAVQADLFAELSPGGA